MEQVDQAFAKMKHTESIGDIDDIQNTLTRNIEQTFQNYSKIYDISRAIQDVLGQNEQIVRYNKETKILVKKLNIDEKSQGLKEKEADAILEAQVEDLAPELEILELACGVYTFWSDACPHHRIRFA